MTVLTRTGTWTSRSTTGTDVITGVGFTPKVIIVYNEELGNAQLNAFNDHTALHFGIAVGTTASTDQLCFNVTSLDAVASSTTYGASFNGIITAGTSGGAYSDKATISAIGSDGFTVNWSQISAAHDFFYLCIGGTDITNVDVGTFALPTAGTTGNVGYTGPGFKPDFLMLFGNLDTLFPRALAGGVPFQYGFGNSTGQCALSVVSEGARATMDTGRYQRTDKVLVCQSWQDTAAKMVEATLTSLDTNGFTLNYTTVTADAAAGICFYLAIKGIRTAIGSLVTPITGSPPVSQTTTTNFLPTGLMLFSTNNTAQTILQDNNRFTIGAASDSTHRWTGWQGDTDNVADGICVRYTDTAKVCLIALENITSTSSTKKAVADLTSFNTNDFTLSWSTIDASNAYQVLYIAFSSLPVTTIRSLSDTLTTTETRTIKAIKTRADTGTSTETRLIKAIKLRSDTNSASESLSRIWIHIRTLSDTLSKSEALIKKAVKLRSDTLARSEAIIKKAIISRTETMAKSESLIKKSMMPRSETFAKSESMIKKAIKLRSDTLAKSETLTKKAIKIRSDTLAKSETLLKKTIKLLSDTLGKSETLTGTKLSGTIVRTLSDTYAATGESIRKLVSHMLQDTAGKSETLISLRSHIRTLSDTLAKSETLQSIPKRVRALSDTYGRSESIIKIAKMVLSDIYGVSETRGVLRQFYRNLSDSYSKSETLQKVATKIRSDVGGFNEGLLKRVSRYLSDTRTASESLASHKIFFTILRTLSDTYTAAESLTKNVTHYLEDIIGGGGGFKQFVHQIVDTYIATETLQSFVFRISAPLVSREQRLEQIAKDVKLSWQRRLVKQPIDMPLPLTSNKTIVRTLTDNYSATENIQTNVFRERIITTKVLQQQQVADPRKVNTAPLLGRQLPAAASLITETIIKKLNEQDHLETALAFKDHLKLKEQEEKTIKVVKQIEQSMKLITKDNVESRLIKARKLGKLIKLNKLIDLIRRVNTEKDE